LKEAWERVRLLSGRREGRETSQYMSPNTGIGLAYLRHRKDGSVAGSYQWKRRKGGREGVRSWIWL
jgi:hypothetical protein